MQLVIPMSGFGERFRRAGYTTPKPLIQIEGKPLVHHVLDLFPGVERVVFICNDEHLSNPHFRMREQLLGAHPSASVLGIAPHKLGPVHAISAALEVGLVDLADPVVVNYCDFACRWDFDHFRRFVAESGCAGCIPCYTGFHPHMLGSTNYAYVDVNDDERGRRSLVARAIQEKEPFTPEPTREYASSGTYYFASGALLARACSDVVERELRVGGEYYVSLAYRSLLDRGDRVLVYPLEHFMQWGTPEDLNEYRYWSDAFRYLVKDGTGRRAELPGTLLMPMAGAGSRFREWGLGSREADGDQAAQGPDIAKPLLAVTGRPMALRALDHLPETDALRVVLNRQTPDVERLRGAIAESYPNASFETLEGVTDGQARSCLEGLDGVDLDAPLTIAACDCGLLYDSTALHDAFSDADVDVFVWTARGYPRAARTPRAYGWVDVDATDGGIRSVSVKEPLEDPGSDPVIVGAFTFRYGRDFVAVAERMIARDARVRGEFYVDTTITDAIALGLRCREFEVERYLSWGTPDELRTYHYWQSCFDAWEPHPYSLAADPRVSDADASAFLPTVIWDPPRAPADGVGGGNGRRE